MPATPHSLVRELRRVPELADLDDAVLIDLVGASVNLFWAAGSSVFEVGDPGEALYVVLDGRVRIVAPDNGQEIAMLGPGDSFGGNAVLGRQPHSKSAVAVDDVELMVISRESLEPVLVDHPALEPRIRRTLEERGGDAPVT